MGSSTTDVLDIRNGTVSFIVHIPGTVEPRIVRRIVGPRRHIMLFGRDDDSTAPKDLLAIKPDLVLRLPRPVAHTFSTDQPDRAVIVVSSADTLDDATAERLAQEPRNEIRTTTSYFVLELQMEHELYVIAGQPESECRNEAIRRLRETEALVGPGELTVVKVATTRKPGPISDYLFFEFLTPEKFAAKEAAGELVQVNKTGGVSYAIDVQHALDILTAGDGLCVLISPRVDELLTLGYPISVTEIDSLPN